MDSAAAAPGVGRVEFRRHHERRALAIVDAAVFHVGAADTAHDVVDDLFFEGHAVVVIVVGGAHGAGGHDEADAEGGNREPGRLSRSLARTIHPLASVLRITLFLLTNLAAAKPFGQAHLEGSYQPGSGRFCGGYPQQGIIQ